MLFSNLRLGIAACFVPYCSVARPFVQEKRPGTVSPRSQPSAERLVDMGLVGNSYSIRGGAISPGGRFQHTFGRTTWEPDQNNTTFPIRPGESEAIQRILAISWV